MAYLIPIIIIVAIFGYMFFLKSSGKLGAWQKNMMEAEEDVNANFDKYFAELKLDSETFKPIIEIIQSDFIGLTECNKPQTMLGALGETAKTIATGVVVTPKAKHLLVLTQNSLHYLFYDSESKTAIQHTEYLRSSMVNVVLGKGSLTDNLKQTMEFKLKGGGYSGEKDNSKLKKLTFTVDGKNHEYFLHDGVVLGEGLKVDVSMGSLTMNASVEDIKRQILPGKIGERFFENIVK